MSTLSVNNITEKTTGAGVKIPGHPIQTVTGSYSTASSTASTSAVQMWSGISITPKFSNSLIHVQVNWYAVHHDYYDGYIQLAKNGSLHNQMIVVRNAAHTGNSFVTAGSRSIVLFGLGILLNQLVAQINLHIQYLDGHKMVVILFIGIRLLLMQTLLQRQL